MRRSLIESGSRRKYLLHAIGEITLVVIGILIALQINNWNDRAKERRQEKISLQNLLQEQESNLGQLEEKIAACQHFVAADTFLLTLFDAPEPIRLEEQSDLLLRNLASPITFDPGNGVMSDLINSGKINLIRNDSLKFMISEWPGELAEVKEAEEFLFDISILPMKTYLRNRTAIRKEYQEYIGTSKFQHDTDIFNDRTFENLIVEALANLSFLEHRYQTMQVEIEQMIQLIKQELD